MLDICFPLLYNLNVRESRERPLKPTFLTSFYVVFRDKQQRTLKIKQRRETRNYFESICGDTESTQEITDVELHRGNLENRLFKTRKRNFEQN